MPVGVHRRHFADQDGAGSQAVKAVAAVRRADRGQVAGIEHAVGVQVGIDRPPGQDFFAGFLGAVGVAVIEQCAADVTELEVAEIGAADGMAGRQRDAETAARRCGDEPAGKALFYHPVTARREVVEGIAAVAAAHGLAFAGVQHAIAVGVQEEGAAGQRGFQVVVGRVVAGASIQIEIDEAMNGGRQNVVLGPPDGAAAHAGIAGQIVQSGRVHGQRVSAGSAGDPGKATDTPGVAGQPGDVDARIERHIAAIPAQAQVLRIESGAVDGFVHRHIHRVYRRGARIGRHCTQRGDGRRRRIEEDVLEGVAGGIARRIDHPHAHMVIAAAGQREGARERVAGDGGVTQFGVRRFVGEPHGQAVFRQVAGQGQGAGVGQAVGAGNAAIGTQYQIGRRLRFDGVHRPAFRHGTRAGIAGQIAQAGSIHRQGVLTILAHLPVETGDAPGMGIDLCHHGFTGQQIGAAVLGQRQVMPVETGRIDRFGKRHVQRHDHRIARIGGQVFDADQNRRGGIHAPGLAEAAGTGNAIAILGAGGRHRQHVIALAAGKGIQAADAEGAGVQLRHCDPGIQRQRNAVAGQAQIAPVEAGRIHRPREADVQRGDGGVAQGRADGLDGQEHRCGGAHRPIHGNAVAARVAGLVGDAVGVYRQAIVAVRSGGGAQAGDTPGGAAFLSQRQAGRQRDVATIELQMQVGGTQRGRIDRF